MISATRAAEQGVLPGRGTYGEGGIQARSTANSIDAHVAQFPPEARKALEQMRATIQQAAPDATETISYAMPSFDLNGRRLVHFAGYSRHIGF